MNTRFLSILFAILLAPIAFATTIVQETVEGVQMTFEYDQTQGGYWVGRIPSDYTAYSSYNAIPLGTKGKVTIPEKVNGAKVIGISTSSFASCDSITEVAIPAGVKYIYSNAFALCVNLRAVNIPEGVTHIRGYAFSGCRSLKQIVIPKTVERMGDVGIGSVETVFQGCDSITSFVVDPENTTYDSHDDCNALFYKKPKTLCRGFNVSTIPSDTKYIGDGAFSGCTRITAVELPAGVTSIGEDAFQGCTSLTAIHLPAALTEIESYAFSGCSSLQRVEIDDLTAWCNISFGDYDANPLLRASHLFLNGQELTTINIPEGVTTINNKLFAGFKGITGIVIPSTVTEISMGAFANCPNLASINVNAANTIYDSRQGCNAVIATSENKLVTGCKNTIVPTSVTSLESYAFSGCSALTYISLPESIESMGMNTFENCTSLQSVNIPSKVTTIYQSTFSGCSSLASITLPQTLKGINDYAFRNCTSIKELHIPASVTSISSGSFLGNDLDTISVDEANTVYDSRHGCNAIINKSSQYIVQGCKNTQLTAAMFDLQGKTLTIGKLAFAGCRGLKTFTFPPTGSGTVTIGYFAFSGSDIEQIVIPEEVWKIEPGAFEQCQSLRSVIFHATPQMGVQSFYGCSSLTTIVCYSKTAWNSDNTIFKRCDNATVYVPKGSSGSYRHSSTWNSLKIVDGFVAYPPQFSCVNHLLTISCETWGSTIYYTTDGTQPTTGSQLYTEPIVMDHPCTVKAMAVADEDPSEVSTFVWLEQTCSNVSGSFDGRHITLTADDGAAIYYTTDGTLPTLQSRRYSSAIPTQGFLTVKAFAVAEGKNDSDISSYQPPCYYFAEDNRVEVRQTGTLASAFAWNGGAEVRTLSINGEIDATDVSFLPQLRDLEQLDMSQATITHATLPDSAFAGMSLVSVLFPPRLSHVGNALFYGCDRLAALQWYVDAPLPAATLDGVTNPNLLIYVNLISNAPAGIGNVVVRGIARELTLSDTPTDCNANFFCPRPFVAEKATYTHHYGMQTVPGTCQGWETLALPFNVEQITHETNGQVTPFADDTSPNSHFWLYAIDQSGFHEAANIEAYVPYLISMPNNSQYADRFCLNGQITFSASNATIAVTPASTELVRQGPTFALMPIFQAAEEEPTLFALNVQNQYISNSVALRPGSTFVRGLRQARPFEACVTLPATDARQCLPLQELMDNSSPITLHLNNSSLTSTSPHLLTSSIYNTSGQLVRTVNQPAGTTPVEGLQSGIYIVGGKKLVIRK